MVRLCARRLNALWAFGIPPDPGHLLSGLGRLGTASANFDVEAKLLCRSQSQTYARMLDRGGAQAQCSKSRRGCERRGPQPARSMR